MTLVIQLPPELERQLSAAASSEGLGLADYAVQLLRTALPTSDAPLAGAEVVAAWTKEGVLGAWADRVEVVDSAEFARGLRAQAEARWCVPAGPG